MGLQNFEAELNNKVMELKFSEDMTMMMVESERSGPENEPPEPRKAKEGRPEKQPNKYAYGVDVTLLCLKEPGGKTTDESGEEWSGLSEGSSRTTKNRVQGGSGPENEPPEPRKAKEGRPIKQPKYADVTTSYGVDVTLLCLEGPEEGKTTAELEERSGPENEPPEPRKAKEGRPIKQPNNYADVTTSYGVDVTLLCLKDPVVRSMYNLVSSYYPYPPHCTAILPLYNRSSLLLHSTCTKPYSIINPELKFDHRGD